MSILNLSSHPLRLGGEEEKKVHRLYLKSFPPDERPPFSMLLSSYKKQEAHFDVYEDEAGFIGFAYIIENEDTAYLFFLAVDSRRRNSGHGSAILASLAKTYEGKTLFLLAEDPEVGDDQTMRNRRIAFYARNGFLPSGIKAIEYGVQYVFLCHHGHLTTQKWFDVMRQFLGEKRFEKYYLKNVKVL